MSVSSIGLNGASTGIDKSPQSELATLTKQLAALEQKVLDVSNDKSLTAKQKEEQVELLQAQMTMVEARIQQIEARQAQQNAKAQEKKVADGQKVNAATDHSKDKAREKQKAEGLDVDSLPVNLPDASGLHVVA